MKNESRGHHYISQIYLRGFTESGKEKIYVLDSIKKEVRKTNIKNIGKKRDFYRINIPSLAPDIIEKELSKIESELKKSISSLQEKNNFVGEDKQNILMIGIFIARNPGMREARRDFEERTAKNMLSLSFRTREQWDRYVKDMQEKGEDLASLGTYEEMKEFIENEDYRMRLPNERHIGEEFKLVKILFNLLIQRKWVLYKTDDLIPFITAESPVSLIWDEPEKMGEISPGFGMPKTTIIFPLTKNFALKGSFEGEDKTVEATIESVAGINSLFLAQSSQIYARDLSFKCMDEKMQLVDGNSFTDKLHFMKKYSI